MTDPKIRYDIEAGIKGEADVGQLASTVRQLGETLEGNLKTSAIEAANALDLLGARKDAVTNFAELRRTTQQLTAELDQATASVDRLGNEIPAAAVATTRFAEADIAMLLEMTWWDSPLEQIQDGMDLFCSNDIAGLYRRWQEASA